MNVVYVVRNSEGRLYIGQTDDLEARLRMHQADQAGWTHGRGPWQLVYSEEFPDRASTMRNERVLKSGQGNIWLRCFLNGRAGPSEKD